MLTLEQNCWIGSNSPLRVQFFQISHSKEAPLMVFLQKWIALKSLRMVQFFQIAENHRGLRQTILKRILDHYWVAPQEAPMKVKHEIIILSKDFLLLKAKNYLLSHLILHRQSFDQNCIGSNCPQRVQFFQISHCQWEFLDQNWVAPKEAPLMFQFLQIPHSNFENWNCFRDKVQSVSERNFWIQI